MWPLAYLFNPVLIYCCHGFCFSWFLLSPWSSVCRDWTQQNYRLLNITQQLISKKLTLKNCVCIGVHWLVNKCKQFAHITLASKGRQRRFVIEPIGSETTEWILCVWIPRFSTAASGCKLTLLSLSHFSILATNNNPRNKRNFSCFLNIILICKKKPLGDRRFNRILQCNSQPEDIFATCVDWERERRKVPSSSLVESWYCGKKEN